MDSNKAWERFCTSGKIEDYLIYSQIKGQNFSAVKGEVVEGADINAGSSSEGFFPR